jgi:hypothetical protein
MSFIPFPTNNGNGTSLGQRFLRCNRAMRCSDELDVRKMRTHVSAKLPLPPRMEVKVDFIDQDTGGEMSRLQIDTFAAVLRRDGVDIVCTVMANRISLPSTNLHEHVRPSIVRVGGEVSDGIYELLMKGKTIPVTLRNGQWVAP